MPLAVFCSWAEFTIHGRSDRLVTIAHAWQVENPEEYIGSNLSSPRHRSGAFSLPSKTWLGSPRS